MATKITVIGYCTPGFDQLNIYESDFLPRNMVPRSFFDSDLEITIQPYSAKRYLQSSGRSSADIVSRSFGDTNGSGKRSTGVSVW